jgi:hypothetical protein
VNQPPLRLTDRQLRLVEQGAAIQPLRDFYLRPLGRRLGGEPSDYALQTAANLALEHVTAFLNSQEFSDDYNC